MRIDEVNPIQQDEQQVQDSPRRCTTECDHLREVNRMLETQNHELWLCILNLRARLGVNAPTPEDPYSTRRAYDC